MDMIFVLSSITYAMKARDILNEKQIGSTLTRSLAVRKVRGCGYGLRVKQQDQALAEQILRSAGIRILGITPER